MKYLAKLIYTILILGVFFKMMHWPGGNFGLLIGFCSLSIYKMVQIVFVSRNSTVNSVSKALMIVMNIAQSIVSIALLFKLLHWPGANLLLSVSILYAVVILIWMFFSWSKLNWLHLKIKSIRFFSLFILCSALLATPLKLLLKLQYYDDPILAELSYLHYANPEVEEHWTNLVNYRKSLEK